MSRGDAKEVGRQRRTGAALVVAVATVAAVTAVPAQASLLGGGGLLGGLLGVVTTALDTTTGLLGGADWGYAPTIARMPEVASAVRADQLWAKGVTGKGVGVALIDTGVAPVLGLTSGNVVNGPDLSFDSQSPSPNLDGFGHGTHMAGIIAGNDKTTGGFRGVAPDSTLLSVRVGAHDGAADVSQVVAAVDWVVQHRADPGLNIRVLNLSYGTDGTQSTSLDPLTHAVENAWTQVSLCDDVEMSSVGGAEMAESLLRESGYPRARVLDRRSVEEALSHMAHWQVARDGPVT